jgi:hypothetical protein
MLGTRRINKTRRLIHINFFLQNTMKKKHSEHPTDEDTIHK